MLSDIINVLKFATDPQTRETLRAISNVASSKQSDWRKNIRRMTAVFNPTNWIGVNAFTNELIKRIAATGISNSKLQRFITIYTELINNAYRHGVRGQRDWKISVGCIYSRWFVQLDIADSGKGFVLGEELQKVAFERGNRKRNGKSGLELVQELADSLSIDDRKSRVTVVVAGEERIVIHTRQELIGEHPLLAVTWDDNSDWSFLSPSWEPLRDALERAEHRLVLVRFGGQVDEARTFESLDTKKLGPEKLVNKPSEKKGSTLPLPTAQIRRARSIIFQCALDKHHMFAYVVPQRWVYDEWKADETDNLHFFRNELDAKQWLIENAGSEETPKPKALPSQAKRATGANWDFARHAETPKTHHASVDTPRRNSPPKKSLKSRRR